MSKVNVSLDEVFAVPGNVLVTVKAVLIDAQSVVVGTVGVLPGAVSKRTDSSGRVAGGFTLKTGRYEVTARSSSVGDLQYRVVMDVPDDALEYEHTQLIVEGAGAFAQPLPVQSNATENTFGIVRLADAPLAVGSGIVYTKTQIDAFLPVNILTHGAATGNTGAQNKTAIEAAIAAVAAGGVLHIPKGTFPVSSLSVTKSDITIEGPGRLECAADIADWISWTGNNVKWRGITLDGAEKAQRALVAAAGSQDWDFENVTWEDVRITDTNDPANIGGLTGSATATGIRLLTGCKNFTFHKCWFKRIGYDGTGDEGHPYNGGVGRAARAILCAPSGTAVTWADAVTNVKITDCDFENGDEDKAKVDSDAVVVQNQDANLIPNAEISVVNCRFKYWGWRAIKFQSSGGTFTDNRIESGTTAKATVGPCMRAGIEWFGKHVVCSHNRITGGSIEHPINAFSDGAYQCDHFEVIGNEITLSEAGSADSYAIWLKSARYGTVKGNTIAHALYGLRLQGDCQQVEAAGNVYGKMAANAVLTIAEATAGDTWVGVAPSNCKVDAVAKETTGFVINAAVGSAQIEVGTVKATTHGGLVTFGAGVVGWRRGYPKRIATQAAAAQAVTSSTALVDITELVIPIEANRKYNFRVFLPYNQIGAVAGIRLGMNGPAAPTSFKAAAQVMTSSGAVANGYAAATGLIVAATVASAGGKWARVEGTIHNGVNAGNLAAQFAQTVSDGDATQILRGATLEVEETE